LLQPKTDPLLESLPSCTVTSRENNEMDNDIPAFDTIKENMVISILNELSDKNTRQDEESGKDQEQNESSFDSVQDKVSNTDAFGMLRKLVFCHKKQQ
jgi:hypothetical protein